MSETETKSSNSLYANLAEVMAEVGYVQKLGRNEFGGYTYPEAKDVFQKVNKALSSRGVCVSSAATLVHFSPYDKQSGAASTAVVKLMLTFQKDDATVVAVEGLGGGSDKGDKAVMKANTAALKYALGNAFLIAWGDDPEGDTRLDRETAVDEICAAFDECKSKSEFQRLKEQASSMPSKHRLGKREVKRIQDCVDKASSRLAT